MKASISFILFIIIVNIASSQNKDFYQFKILLDTTKSSKEILKIDINNLQFNLNRSSNLIHREAHYLWLNNSWKFNDSTRYFYNAGKLVQILQYTSHPLYKIDINYNSLDFVDTIYRYYNDAGNWKYIDRIVYEYTSFNKYKRVYNESRDSLNISWTGIANGYLYEYDSLNRLKEFYWTDIDLNNNTYLYWERYLYSYDNLGFVKEIELQDYEREFLFDFFDNSKYHFYYNSNNGELALEYFIQVNPINYNWDTITRRINYQWYKWLTNETELMFYENLLTEYTLQSKNQLANQFQNSYKEVRLYDLEDNLIQNDFFEWDMNNWYKQSNCYQYLFNRDVNNLITEKVVKKWSIQAINYLNYEKYVYNDAITSMQEQSKLLNSKIYPNPNNGEFYIEWNKFDDLEIDVYNSQGQLINKQKVAYPFKINIANNQAGFYWIKIEDSENSIKVFPFSIIK